MNFDLGKYSEQISENPTKRAYASSVAVGLLLILAVLLIVPSANSLLSLYKEVSAAKKTDHLLKERLFSLQKAQDSFNLVQSSVSLVNSSLPDNPEITSLVKDLEVTASRSAVQIESIQMSETLLSQNSASNELKTTQGLTFNLSLSGDYPNLKDYLQRLEKRVRTTAVDSISFSTKLETGGKLVISVSAKTYYFGVGKSAAKKKEAKEESLEKN